jgi:D-arabinose 1-dehydrogenase-like Zn-dependent alcohol dehydrogenase
VQEATQPLKIKVQGNFMARMKVVQVRAPRADWEIGERDIPQPGAGEVRIKVEACGICHSDMMVKDGLWPGLQYPRVPGHEIAGRIDAVGSGADWWKVGQRVGVGWTDDGLDALRSPRLA